VSHFQTFKLGVAHSPEERATARKITVLCPAAERIPPASIATQFVVLQKFLLADEKETSEWFAKAAKV